MDGVSARAKRRWLAVWWACQAVCVYFGFPLFASVVWSGDWKDVGRALFDADYAAWMLGTTAVVTLMQFLFLLPVRAPSADGRRRTLFWSMTVGGFVFATLAAAALAAGLGVAHDLGGMRKGSDDWVLPAVLGVFAMNWLLATPMLLAFTDRAADAEDRLARVATRLFAGTLVEVLAAVPLDVLARRKNDCTCGRGTFWAILFGLLGGLILCGPVVFLVLLRRRRRRWPGGRCVACGADVGDELNPKRCPKCGAGWAE